jgi:intraflagellar transport protein 46
MQDEPALNQSDKAKIDLQLINNNKQYRGAKNSKVHAIENAEKNPKQIQSWISSVAEIHKTKQPPSVSYSKQMPDIDSLMQVWPEEVEELFSEVAAPSEEIDLSLADYSKVACNILDIPVHQGLPNSLVESLHVMFTLYSAFKESQHFNKENESYVDQR